MVRCSLLVVFAASCGRVDFDEIDATGPGVSDMPIGPACSRDRRLDRLAMVAAMGGAL
jgi:hypothetical protein